VIEWRDEGIVLSVRAHGENDAIASLMTFEHGRHLGLVRGGTGRRQSPLLQSGNRLECVWKARLADHLGAYTVEPLRLYMATMLDDAVRLAAVGSACALMETSLAERDPHPDLYAALVTLMGRLSSEPAWPEDYVRFELLLLAELGFALDLSACAVTGVTEGLRYVSPRTGRAVSEEGAGAYVSRLLPLPAFLMGQEGVDEEQVMAGLRLAGHFIRRHILEPADRAMPPARERLLSLLQPKTETPAR
jgi:DNA repair protein RecO (recombination protein O)